MLSERETEMIAVGASVASGCVPCTAFHLKVAAAAGVGSEDLRSAASEAVRISSAATAIMAGHAGLSPVETGHPETELGGERSLILELVAVGAAYAACCPAGLTDHMAAARREGASDAQILTALKIACAVRDVAGQKAKAAAAAFFGADEAEAAACDCSEGDAPAEEAAGGCSCGEDDQGTNCASPEIPSEDR